MDKRDLKNSVILFCASLALYLWHLAPGLTAEDSGNFLMGAKFAGTIHPPGYPLYVLLASLFGRIPFSDFAFNVNFMSAFFASGALVAFYLGQRVWLKCQPFIAGCSTVALALHFLFWAEAEIAEVYSLNAFLFCSFILFVGLFTARKEKRFLFASVFIFGLGLSNHYPLMILAGAPLIVFAPGYLKEVRTQFLKVIGFGTLGLLPYLLLVINATLRNPEYNFGKLSSLNMLVTHILRSQYSGVDQAGGTFVDKFHLVVETAKTLTFGFGAYGPAFLLGLYVLAKTRDKSTTWIPASLFSSWILLIIILGFKADERHFAIFEAYMVPAVVLAGFIVTLGLKNIELVVAKKFSPNSLGFALALAIAVSLSYPIGTARANHRDDTVVANWAKSLLTSMEPNSSVILCGTDVFAVYYTHFVEGIRPDLKLYDQFSVFTKENLYGDQLLFQRPDPLEARKRFELALAKDESRAVVYLCSDSPKDIGLKVDPLPYGFRVGSGGATQSLREEDENLLRLAASPSAKSEYWLKLRRQVIFSQFINYYGVKGDEASLAKVLVHFKSSDLIDDKDLSFKVANNLALNKRYVESIELFKLLDHKKYLFQAEDLSNICGMMIQVKNLDEALTFCDRGLREDKGCHKGLRQNSAFIYQAKGDLQKSQSLLTQCL